MDDLTRSEASASFGLSIATPIDHPNDLNDSSTTSVPAWSVPIHNFGRGVQHAVKPFWLFIIVAVVLVLIFTGKLTMPAGIFKETEDAP
ncbi:unnamed protein product [Peniophora sp. CBMAI 1063]|nr:unnamed protein product [Peniophora sp. CBMAI 1063]